MRTKFPGLLRAAQLSGVGGRACGSPRASPIFANTPCRAGLVGVGVCPGASHHAGLPVSLHAVTLLSPRLKSGGCHNLERDPLWHRL